MIDNAKWIGAPHEYELTVNVRKLFTVRGHIKKATLYATARGFYEPYINGKRVCKTFYNPGFTDYRKRIYYQTYDVTDNIKAGENVIGATITKGYYTGCVGYSGAHFSPRSRWNMRTEKKLLYTAMIHGSLQAKGPLLTLIIFKARYMTRALRSTGYQTAIYGKSAVFMNIRTLPFRQMAFWKMNRSSFAPSRKNAARFLKEY